MIKDITLGQYIPGKSPLHRSDPRVKIILSILNMVLIFLVNNYFNFLILYLFTGLIITVSEIPLRYTLKGLKPIAIIVIFTVIINLFTVKGTPIFRYGPVEISLEGIDISVKLALRLSLMVIITSLLTLTTTPILLTDAIESLMKPLKYLRVPVHEIAMMMTISLRFIPTLLDETEKIMKAQASRGADFDSGNILEKAKSFIPILVPLFVSAFRRADEMAIAMEARCYRGSEGRTRMKQLKITSVDYKIIAVTLAVAAALLYLQYA
ncbi:MAG: energy-coupling factor transporter transmembrane protein EcfT [Clostridiaceae bacterium]|jgi:energy-coupling factor transport system permease protein|nr:energy-coupling factor transporter transmembrane protein EcfT [Clostridiaceae bacterium]